MPVIRAILFSSFFHFLLIGLVIWLVPKLDLEPTQTIEVALYPEGQILEALTPKKQQVVRQALVPDKLKAPEDESLARFLSEQKQRVREETRARQTGMTANRNNQEGPSHSTPPTPTTLTAEQQKSSDDISDDGYRTVDITKDLQEMNRFNQGFSTVGENMPRDMKIGSFTALNTDRYLFYTFYARMEELVRYRWESRVQQAIHTFDRVTLAGTGNRNWVTHVEFLLDKEGVLKSALIMKESGIPPFDAAAINAFKEARIFPNPPPEMVQDDGFIHVKFSFTVNFSPPALVNRN
ncbi:MAG: TonB family protein [Bdellovibrio sp.]